MPQYRRILKYCPSLSSIGYAESPLCLPLLVRGSLDSRILSHGRPLLDRVHFDYCEESYEHAPLSPARGHKRFKSWPSAMKVRIDWKDGTNGEAVIYHCGEGTSRICFASGEASVPCAFKFGDRAYRQNDNRTEYEANEPLPDGLFGEQVEARGACAGALS